MQQVESLGVFLTSFQVRRIVGMKMRFEKD